MSAPDSADIGRQFSRACGVAQDPAARGDSASQLLSLFWSVSKQWYLDGTAERPWDWSLGRTETALDDITYSQGDINEFLERADGELPQDEECEAQLSHFLTAMLRQYCKRSGPAQVDARELSRQLCLGWEEVKRLPLTILGRVDHVRSESGGPYIIMLRTEEEPYGVQVGKYIIENGDITGPIGDGNG